MADWPYPFYVCGERMPRFGAMWHYVYAGPDVDVHDHQVDIRVQDVLFAMDHDYDSEESGVVEICANQVLLTLMEYWDDHLMELTGNEEALAGSDPETVLTDLKETLFRVIQISREQPVVWWFNVAPDIGLEHWQKQADAALAFTGDSLDSPWPHRARVRKRIESQRTWNRADLHRLAHSGRFDKETRRRLLDV